jgi:mannosylglycerate hydrolase
MAAETDASRIHCHWISNTHWDREWRFSAQRTRYKLVEMLDRLLDIFETHPEYKHFHLDSQTMPLQDYLEIRPEREGTIRNLVTDGRLAVGPWFCLPDEFCVGGESLIRNLLLGHRIARRFGAVSKTGYSPFSWGQISQMPQLYTGFGIDMMSFYRGTNTIQAKGKSEYWWQGPDGTRILVSRLAPRPRYNVWYLIQRAVFWNLDTVERRYYAWTQIGGPFRLLNEPDENLDGLYIHPQYAYHAEHIPAQTRVAIDEQTGHWTTPHRFWSSGHDSSSPDVREIRMIADCGKALAGEADVFHSTVKAWQDGVLANVPPDLPVVEGEMHHPAAPGSSSELIGWIISARTYIKQENFATERALTHYAEPLSVIAALLGTAYPLSYIDTAYNWLLQNHGHDSIAGCARDVVHDDMMYRYRQAREIGSCLTEQGMMELCRSIDFSDWSPDDVAMVVYNPAAFARDAVTSLVLDVPAAWQCDGIAIHDADGRQVVIQVIAVDKAIKPLYAHCSDVVNVIPSVRYRLRAALSGIPALGYKAFKVSPVHTIGKVTTGRQPVSMLTGPQSMANALIEVAINPNGTLDIVDRRTGKQHRGLGYFRDSSETGDPWVHTPTEQESVYTTLNETARIALLRDGALETVFRVELDWALPESSIDNDTARSPHLTPYPIVNTVTLRHGQPWVEISTEVDNTVENHYLQVCFPSDIQSDTVHVQGQFDIIARSMLPPDHTLYYEKPQSEQPMNSFIDISNGQHGLGLLNDGLKAYTGNGDPRRTLNITLLRCFPMKLCAMDDRTDYTRTDRGGQCPGRHTFRYGIAPHAGDWAAANLWRLADRFNLPFVAAQTGPTQHGHAPRERSFLELDNPHVQLSALKRSEDASGWVVRLFNTHDGATTARLRFNGGRAGQTVVQSPTERVAAAFALPDADTAPWREITAVTLEELPLDPLARDADGWVSVALGPRRIVTILFR